MIELKEISIVEYPKFFHNLRELHQDQSKSPVHPDSPLEEADRMTRRFLQEGLNTRDHFLYRIMEQDQDVGYLWAGKEKDRPGFIQIWDMMIYQPYRRKGHGQEAMKALEVLLKSQGVKGLDLHVGSANQEAINLYNTLGFHVTDLVMHKSL